MSRISTTSMYNNAVSAILQRQTDMSRTQTQVATGLRVRQPSDDPNAAVRIIQLDQANAAETQYGKNIAAVQSQLQVEEQALATTLNTIQRMYELTIQANNGAFNASDRQSIVTELRELNSSLLDNANRKNADGEYIFSGLSVSVQPFVRNGSGVVTYAGDGAERQVQVGTSQYVQQSDSGFDTFMNIPEGNGTFVASAANANTGTGIIAGTVQDISAWVRDDYTLTFTSATAWTVTDSASNVVTSGTYTAGAAIAFNGIQVTVTGAPATGDVFNVNASNRKNIFQTIDDLISAISAPQGSDAAKAQFQNNINLALEQLDQAQSHVLGIRIAVGARLTVLEAVEGARQNSMNQTTALLSTLRDVDYAEAVSRLNQQFVGLQAAQQSYAKIAQLSLFNFL